MGCRGARESWTPAPLLFGSPPGVPLPSAASHRLCRGSGTGASRLVALVGGEAKAAASLPGYKK